MQTDLAPWAQQSRAGLEADAILRKCVHCGFCTATCPTYQILGDELDGPRGRIYLIKDVLEGAPPSRDTQLHLDRCLTCRNCETTCPSGVEYGHLIDIGRQLVDERVTRSWSDSWRRHALRILLRPAIFAGAMRVGRWVKPLLPSRLASKLQPMRPAGAVPDVSRHARQVWLLSNCVQPAMMPAVDAASVRVLDRLGVRAAMAPNSGCCGAIDFHLSDTARAQAAAKRNIDAWWPGLHSGEVEALVMNASGCGATVREYGHLLKDDAQYAQKARYISDRVMDIGEYLQPHVPALLPMLRADSRVMAFHPPCTLQHWQSLGLPTDQLLSQLGFLLKPFADRHLCCGSAGTYSILQSELSTQLRERKLVAIGAAAPQVILSANVGCIGHLQAGTEVPVMHWIEALDQRLYALE